MQPVVDINLFVHDGATTVAAAIDSVLAQSYTNWRLTLIDDGSTDGTAAILADYAARHPAIALKRHRCNAGAVVAFQRAFWTGDADFVMPKSADDLIAPDFVERVMALLLAHRDCAMAHAAGLSFSGPGNVQFCYPPGHNLHAVDADPMVRAVQVMAHYTSSPAFWGIYRREAVDRLAPIAYRAGWDHVLLAELALYGEIRHVPEVLYWRRGVGRPVLHLARAATQEHARGIAPDTPASDALWRMPCITTAFAHIENFSLALQRELAAARHYIRETVAQARDASASARSMVHLQLTRMLAAVALVLPGRDLSCEHALIATLYREEAICSI